MAEKLLLTEIKAGNYGDHASVADDVAYLDDYVSSDHDSEMLRSVFGGDFMHQEIADQFQ